MSGFSATVRRVGKGDYVIRTNLPPDKVSDLGVFVFTMWMAFAQGRRSLGGKKLMHPTGKYAASLRFEETRGERSTAVAIYADEAVAPESAILETGHKRWDMKQKLQFGRIYPMHRDSAGWQGTGGPQMWAERRADAFTGFSALNPNSTGWIMPAMPAYSPAKILSDLAAAAARGMQP